MINLIIFLLAFIGMEAVAWFTHKYIMHGILWKLHKDHHTNENEGFLQHNDFFFLIFAIPGICLLIAGINQNLNYLFWAGMGISLYGLAYFLVHDIFIHQRFKLLRNTRNFYFMAVRRAHKVHHKHLDKTDGECFGMLWIPFKYYRKQNSEKKK